MYVLVKKEDLDKRNYNKFCNVLPDGRCIIPLADMKMLGSINDVDFVSSARELKALQERLAEEQEKAAEEVENLTEKEVQDGGE